MLKIELDVLNQLMNVAGRGLQKRIPQQKFVITLLAIIRASHRTCNQAMPSDVMPI